VHPQVQPAPGQLSPQVQMIVSVVAVPHPQFLIVVSIVKHLMIN
jgi:hypothetical protein